MTFSFFLIFNRLCRPNRLLEHSGNDDPRVCTRALGLPGKSVGMFTDRTEVGVKELSTEEWEAGLKEKLENILRHSPHLLDTSFK